MLRPGTRRRLQPEALFQPRSVLLVGADTAGGRAVAANMAGFGGRFAAVESAGEVAGAEAADLAVLACGAEEVGGALRALAAGGTFSAVCLPPLPAAELAAAAAAAAMQVLGPASFGVVVPGLGLNASAAHVPVAAGKVALVSQSAALCRAVLDWAGPNGVGFSHVIGVGGNAQTGFNVALDWLSRDPNTGAILLDIRTIRNPRLFLAAARAAARLRPVVAIRAGGRLLDASGRADAVLDAALRRAGVLRVTTMAGLLGAAEVLTRARPARSETVAIVTNAVGPAHLAADAAVASGLRLLRLDEAARAVLRLRLPAGPADPGITWTGADGPIRVAEAASLLAGLKETGGIVAILSPTGAGDAAGVAALAAARSAMKVPLLACVPGETTGAAHRRTLAAAGVPVFATPETAVAGLVQLVRQRQARAAAAELPPRRVLEVAPDHAAVAAVLAGAREAGRAELAPGEALAVLRAYGIAVAEEGGAVGEGGGLELRIGAEDDPVFGPAVGFGLGGAAADLLGDVAFELPPLNLALARGLIGRTRAGLLLGEADGAGTAAGAADALVRVSQLLLDHPEIGRLRINPLVVAAGADGRVVAGAAAIGLRPAGQAARWSIAPYPAELEQVMEAGPERLVIRPIRPEDAEAHAALFRRLTPEDVRYRFFNMLRELPAEQIARMTQVDYDREMAFVAVRANGDTAAVCRLVCEPGGEQGEFAVVVEPALKGHGLATRLMRCLLDWGRSRGLRRVVGQVLAENAVMLGFMRRLGAEIRRLPEEPDVVEAVIALQ